ncbi:MAG: hypothetical protein QXX41_08920 [Nitrososphaerota archaeon]
MKRKENEAEDVLMLDIDFMPKPWYDKWLETREVMLNHLGYKLTKAIKHPSPSGKGLHVWLHIKGPPLTDMEKVKLQFFMGDDPVRSKINYRRVRRGIKSWWNKLFSVKHVRAKPSKRCMNCRILRAVKELEGEEEIWSGSQ